MYETIFVKELLKNPKKLKLFMHYYNLGLIQEFDDEIKSILRRLYYGGFIDGIIYLYYMPTDSQTIGDKVELLCESLKNQEYNIIHAITNSTKNISFNEYKQNALDYNSFIEIKRGNNKWIYDLFSLLKFDKDIYYEMENPILRDNTNKINPHACIVSSKTIEKIKEIYGETDYTFRCPELFVSFIDRIERNVENHPYKDIIKKEIDFQKSLHDYPILKRNKIVEEISKRGRPFNI